MIQDSPAQFLHTECWSGYRLELKKAVNSSLVTLHSRVTDVKHSHFRPQFFSLMEPMQMNRYRHRKLIKRSRILRGNMSNCTQLQLNAKQPRRTIKSRYLIEMVINFLVDCIIRAARNITPGANNAKRSHSMPLARQARRVNLWTVHVFCNSCAILCVS